MKKLILLFLLSPALVWSQNVEVRFQTMVDSLYALHPESVGILIHVEAPDENISWSYATGLADTLTKKPLKKDQPVLIASNTKPYVAAAILRLIENGNLTLDQPIKKLLCRKTRRLLKKDKYNLKKITVAHLLSHTSGIHDYVDDDYFDFVGRNPNYKWKKREQIKRSISIGKPLSNPGEKFKYADINYLLLTEIIEKKTKQSFTDALRALLKFNQLGIKNTWFEGLESYPELSAKLAHQYADKYHWDSYNLDTSWDLYGGGGIASSAKDAALFFQFLFEGKIIKDPSILKLMHGYVLPKETSNYCLGIRNIPFDKFRVYYHGGWWGTDVIYCPETNTSISVFTLQKGKRGLINPYLGKSIQELILTQSQAN